MKLTETLAIIISRDIWLWLSENPEVRKKQYPLYDEFNIKQFNSECPCCSYYYHIDIGCGKCPLGDCRISSYWWKWTDGIDRQENAYNIYKQLDEKLKSME